MPTRINMENSRELEDQFKKLGFSNFVNILKTAHSLSGFARSEETTQTVYLDDINPRRTVDYGFTVESSGWEQNWQILSIAAFAVIDTVRNDRGLMLVQKIYQSSDGPLLNMAQMEKEIMEMVKIEEVKEKFHIEKGRNQEAPRIRRKI